jgi:predicted dehydrogenase
VGFRGRGAAHIRALLKQPGAEIAALCDVDEAVLASGLKTVEAATGRRPAAYTEYRKLLDDKSIDAVTLATPNHHHTLQTIWACQAGKDVYVEKPCSHTMFEARQIVAAARKYGRVVQNGTQSRSSATLREMFAEVRAGLIGEVYMARGLCFKWRDTIGRAKPEPVPAGVHYDLWTGPAPLREFTRNRFHYNWHWNWDYGNGDIGNQGVHEMDVARWGLGVTLPTRVTAVGGHFMFKDDQQTPNMLMATFEFDGPDGAGDKKKILQFEVRGWITNREAGLGEGKNDGATGYMVSDANTIGNTFYGSKGCLVKDVNAWKTFMGQKLEPGPSGKGQANHYANFVEAIRANNPALANGDIIEGHHSAALVHLANISYRLGRSLKFDPKTERFVGDDEANRLLRREYRTPYIVPEKP